ncbi:MAG: hypothetical protein HC792_06275, partial [Acaryochloridaceae cyanobacterium CSU_5_19]|nr:hypothetical protein [Acaryochloridaceae cyanobacterium CSU_5_19]
ATAWQAAQDLTKIAQASTSAWNGTIVGLEDAIQQAYKLGTDRPLYLKAQALIARWQGEIGNVRLLQEAQARAKTGDLQDLTSAVSQAQQVASNSDQFEVAQQEIEEWQSSIETRQDQPILDRADQLALSGNRSGLQAAIKEAQKFDQSGSSIKKPNSGLPIGKIS